MDLLVQPINFERAQQHSNAPFKLMCFAIELCQLAECFDVLLTEARLSIDEPRGKRFIFEKITTIECDC